MNIKIKLENILMEANKKKFLEQINPDLPLDEQVGISDIHQIDSISLNQISQDSEQSVIHQDQLIFQKIVKTTTQLPYSGLISSISKNQVIPILQHKQQKKQLFEHLLEPTSYQQDDQNNSKIIVTNQNNSNYNKQNNISQFSDFGSVKTQQILGRLNAKFQQQKIESHGEFSDQEKSQNNIILTKKDSLSNQNSRLSIEFVEEPLLNICNQQDKFQQIEIYQKLYKKRIMDQSHQNSSDQEMKQNESISQFSDESTSKQKIQKKKIMKQIIHKYYDNFRTNHKKYILDIDEQQKSNQSMIDKRRSQCILQKNQKRKTNTQHKYINQSRLIKQNISKNKFTQLTQQVRYPKRIRVPTLPYWCQHRQKQKGKFVGVTSKIQNMWITQKYQFNQIQSNYNTLDLNNSIYKILGIKQNSVYIIQQYQSLEYLYIKFQLNTKQGIRSKNPNYKSINFRLEKGESTKVSIVYGENRFKFQIFDSITLNLSDKFYLRNYSNIKVATILVKILI